MRWDVSYTRETTKEPCWYSEDIQDVLGHVDVYTTMDIYVDVMNDTKKRELASFDGYMERTRAQ